MANVESFEGRLGQECGNSLVVLFARSEITLWFRIMRSFYNHCAQLQAKERFRKSFCPFQTSRYNCRLHFNKKIRIARSKLSVIDSCTKGATKHTFFLEWDFYYCLFQERKLQLRSSCSHARNVHEKHLFAYSRVWSNRYQINRSSPVVWIYSWISFRSEKWSNGSRV